MSKIWAFIICVSIVVAFLIGNPEIVTETVITDSKTAIENVIGLTGMMCFWSGIFKIFENTSLLTYLSNGINKVIKYIFNKEKLSNEAKKYVSLNMASNILGLGNAATLNGIKAVEEMNKTNKTKAPTDNMTTFVLLNTASLQLIPTTMIAMRALYNSSNPNSILIPVWIVTAVSLIVGLVSIKILNKIMK